MELWIRSQNKGALTKVELLGKIDGTIYSYLGLTQTKLGTYKTDERALEVLDEIQNILKPKTIINTYEVEQAQFCDGTQIIQPMLGDIQVQNAISYVYEMPKE